MKKCHTTTGWIYPTLVLASFLAGPPALAEGDGSGADPNSTVDPDTSFAAETGNSYELGFKTNWRESTVLFDVAAFAQRFTNFQLTVFNGNFFVTTTVPQVSSRGVDLDLFLFARQRRLTLQAGLTYADTAYGSFTPMAAPSCARSSSPPWSRRPTRPHDWCCTATELIAFSLNARMNRYRFIIGMKIAARMPPIITVKKMPSTIHTNSETPVLM